MMLRVAAYVICVLFVISSKANAVLVTLDLPGQATIDGTPSGDLTDPGTGLVATFSANFGELNSTSTDFGINGPGADSGPSGTSRLDASEQVAGSGTFVSECVFVSFSQLVHITEVALDVFSAGETADLTFDSSMQTITDTGASLDVFSFTTNNTIPVGQQFTICHATGNGFSFERLSLNTIPEPSSVLMVCVVGAVAAICRILQARIIG